MSVSFPFQRHAFLSEMWHVPKVAWTQLPKLQLYLLLAVLHGLLLVGF